MNSTQIRKRIRLLLVVFIVGLVMSGLTAIPLNFEISSMYSLVGPSSAVSRTCPSLANWIATVHSGLMETSAKYPFLFYGTDWLAFAHIVIAIAFIGSMRDPVKNVWVIDFGIIACTMIFPTVAIFAPIRGIPLFWALIDCSFGAVGIIPLWLARRYTKRLATMELTGVVHSVDGQRMPSTNSRSNAYSS